MTQDADFDAVEPRDGEPGSTISACPCMYRRPEDRPDPDCELCAPQTSEGRDRQVRGAGSDEPNPAGAAAPPPNSNGSDQAVTADYATGPPSGDLRVRISPPLIEELARPKHFNGTIQAIARSDGDYELQLTEYRRQEFRITWCRACGAIGMAPITDPPARPCGCEREHHQEFTPAEPNDCACGAGCEDGACTTEEIGDLCAGLMGIRGNEMQVCELPRRHRGLCKPGPWKPRTFA